MAILKIGWWIKYRIMDWKCFRDLVTLALVTAHIDRVPAALGLTDGGMGSLWVRGDAELARPSLVFCCDSEDVGQTFYEAFHSHLCVCNQVPVTEEKTCV